MGHGGNYIGQCFGEVVSTGNNSVLRNPYRANRNFSFSKNRFFLLKPTSLFDGNKAGRKAKNLRFS